MHKPEIKFEGWWSCNAKDIFEYRLKRSHFKTDKIKRLRLYVLDTPSHVWSVPNETCVLYDGREIVPSSCGYELREPKLESGEVHIGLPFVVVAGFDNRAISDLSKAVMQIVSRIEEEEG